jgi:hypothetical protein
MATDDFVRFEDGPFAGQTVRAMAWPPPETLTVQDSLAGTRSCTYRRVSYSQITDEQLATMTHVARGAAYQFVEETTPQITDYPDATEGVGWEKEFGMSPGDAAEQERWAKHWNSLTQEGRAEELRIMAEHDTDVGEGYGG